MSVMRTILMRAFGRPRGILGRLGGVIMARTNVRCGVWASDLLQIRPGDNVLEIGFGPGAVVQHLSTLVQTGHVAGVDPSGEMVEQARARNTDAIQGGHIDLRQGSVEDLPFDDDRFDRALAINSMQVWPDAAAGLREIRRGLKPGGLIALGFTPYSGQPRSGLTEALGAAGFSAARIVDSGHGFCAVAQKAEMERSRHGP
jgi:ubiquinone/menaquinone biosynthesis C-methylase UbiE